MGEMFMSYKDSPENIGRCGSVSMYVGVLSPLVFC